MSATFSTIRYEKAAPHVARIVLNRPEKANAQSNQLIYELNAAYDLAAQDDDIKVVILAAEGRHFSSGHDLAPDVFDPELKNVEPVSTWGGFGLPGIEGYWAFEQEAYFEMCWRWRNLPKPTIAEVHGKVIAAGLMLVWPCDLVVASEDATFQDPTVAFGVNGVEYFGHPWELGARKAKEMLFTGRAITAHTALQLGMVNRIVPCAALSDEVTALAQEIARQPMMALKLAKLAVNQAQDAQGYPNALRTAMSLQALGHAHNKLLHGEVGDPGGVDIVKALAKAKPLDQ